jgi:hypothetical protein
LSARFQSIKLWKLTLGYIGGADQQVGKAKVKPAILTVGDRRALAAKLSRARKLARKMPGQLGDPYHGDMA